MAKYCIHCGKKLKEGEVCDCQANVQVQTNDLGTNFVEVLKGMFVKPIDTIKGYTDEKHFNLALILVGVFSLSAALFMLSLVKNMTEMATSSMGGLTLYAITTTSVQIPYLQIFFVGLIAVIAFTFIYTGFLYLVNSVMFKGNRSFKKVFTMYGVNSVITSATLLATAIFMFVNVFLGLAIFVLGYALNMVYMYKGIETLGVKDENKHGYIYLITTLFYGIALFIISLIFS